MGFDPPRPMTDLLKWQTVDEMVRCPDPPAFFGVRGGVEMPAEDVTPDPSPMVTPEEPEDEEG